MMAPAVVDAVGAAGAALTTLCWVPQAVKIIRDRETRAISLPGTALCVIGVLLCFVIAGAVVLIIRALRRRPATATDPAAPGTG